MKRIRLLQIGDIHYPSSKSNSIKIDLKDHAFPAAITQLAAADALHNTFKQILTLLEKPDTRIDGLLLCGDFTSYGNIEGYRDCLRYLNQTLQIKDANRWSVDTIHVVPGNHDIDRGARDPAGDDLYKKFEPLITEWNSFGLNIFDPSRYRATDIVSGDHVMARVFSLNSCIGCGERRFLPEQVREDLATLIETRLGLQYDEHMFPLPQETLDTPAFKEDDITDICEEVKRMDINSVPVILAHHNLLPQAIPRISIYTEVINGGLVRSRLSELGRPTIYCHGHIHDDPVEVVTSPATNAMGLISISAPPIVNGFNVLEIQYGSERTPLGCVVHPYRVQRDGGVKPLTPTRVPLHLKNANKLSGITEKLIFNSLNKLPAFVYHRFDAVYTKVKSRIKQNINTSTVADALLEAEWLGFIILLDREEDCKYWQTQRIVP